MSMSMRRSSNGRPSGTDGSDFSYRMVVESRYQKVANGKSRLSTVILTQAIIQIISSGVIFLSSTKGQTLDRLSLFSSICCFLSLLFGEFGRKRSRVGLLKLYLFGSSITALTSVACLLLNESSFEIIKDFSKWQSFNFELLGIAIVVLGVVVQIFAVSVTTSLVYNMAPPKRAS